MNEDRSHWLKRPRRQSIPKHWLFFDTESRWQTRQEGNATVSRHTLRLFCADYCTMGEEMELVSGYTAYDQETFLTILRKHTSKRYTIWCCAHNLQFDLTMLGFWKLVKDQVVNVTQHLTDGLPFVVRCELDGKRICFVDSLNYSPSSLAEMGKAIGCPKMEMPKLEASDQDWGIYCFNDVRIIRLYVGMLVKDFKDGEWGSWGISMASNAFNCYRSGFMRHSIKITDNKEVTILERGAYHGGDTRPLQTGFATGKFYQLDVNSLYPAMMAFKEFPCRLCDYSKACSVDELLSVSEDHSIIADVLVSTNKHSYKTCDLKGERCRATGRYRVQLCAHELRQALVFHEVEKVFAVASYQVAPIFKDYVLAWHGRKERARKAGDEGTAHYASAMLKTMCGKFAQRLARWEPIDWYDPMSPFGTELTSDPKTGHTVVVRTFAWLSEMATREKEWYHAFPAIAAYITSYARSYMDNLIYLAGREHCYYQATDSLIVDHRGYLALLSQGWIDPTALGKLKVVKEGTELAVLRAGYYRLDDKLVDQSVPRKRTERIGHRVKCEQWGNLNETLKSTEWDSVTVRSFWASTSLFKDEIKQLPMIPCEERWVSWPDGVIDLCTPGKRPCSLGTGIPAQIVDEEE